MFHRTIFIEFSPAATQAEIAGLLSAFQALGGQLAGLNDVSIEFLRGEYDAGIDLALPQRKRGGTAGWMSAMPAPWRGRRRFARTWKPRRMTARPRRRPPCR